MSRSCSTRGRYGDGAQQERFTFALTLVFIQCVINAAFAKIREWGSGSDPPRPPRSGPGLSRGLPAAATDPALCVPPPLAQ